ncbi:lytic polysaccharide monooxygenase [Myxococcaceae bacterium JPH2]|nr:lytic polysaccharide monooxygenase [Myxococcaceae bacterium JPH2]
MQTKNPSAVAPLVLLSSLLAGQALAHGSMEVPISRVYQCYKEGPENPKSAACKAAIQLGGTQAMYDWNGVRQGNANGNHRALIPDGKLCSGGNESHKGLDLARTDWVSRVLTPDASGNFEFVFYATAVHATAYFQLYVTRDGYNPALPLKWSDLETAPFCAVTSITAQSNRFRINCPLPRNKTGSHVVYAIWQRSDSPEAFYSCSDVTFGAGLGLVAPWKELGQVQAREALPARSTVTLRVFDREGHDVESHPVLLEAPLTSEAWLERLAQRVNADSRRVRVGTLQSSGEVAPAKAAQGASVYAREEGVSFQVDILKPSP